MKITVKSAFVASLVLGAIASASAQTAEQRAEIVKNSNVATLNELSAQFSRENEAKHQRVMELAKQNNWSLQIRREDGGVSVLSDVSEDGRTPIYIGTNNQGSAITSRVDRIQPGGVAGLNLDGTDMIAGVWEINKPLANHLDFGGRVTGSYDGGSAAVDLHPTHVCGTIAGSGENSVGGKARGMAYKASIKFWDITDDDKEMAEAAADGLLVSNHSYGLSLDSFNSSNADSFRKQFGTYGVDSKNFDNVTFNAPYYQPVKAAGNDRDGANTYQPGKNGHDLLTAWAVSKNSLVVAAVEEVLDYTGASSVKMSAFSNWGPTDDNRIKPDISAKGVAVYSTSNDPSGKGYAYLDGTSMATPGVVGALTLIQQHYSNLNNKQFMRSATLRGLVAHCADEAGLATGPDSRFGWGLLNAERMAKVISNKFENKSVVLESTLNSGATYTKTVYATGVEPLIVTLSWTDRPGRSTSVLDSPTPRLVNDLDVRVTKDGNTYFPWKLGAGLDDVAEQGDNIVDNLEKVELQLPEAGLYTITVSHKGKLSDGALVPKVVPQDYSLIVSGVDQSLSTQQNDFKEFNVWPNPAKDMLNVSVVSDWSDDASVVVYDVLGKKIIEQKMNGFSNNFSGAINVSNLNSGVYLIKVSQGGKQSVRKFIKE